MASHLKTDIHSYAAALEVWAEHKRRDRIKLAHNTYLVPGPDNHPDTPTPGAEEDCPIYFAVRLHSTDIVTFHANGDVVLDTGGWRTVTTIHRMRAFMPGQWPANSEARPFLLWSLRVKKGAWSVECERVSYVPRQSGELLCGRYDRTVIKSYPFESSQLRLVRSRTAGGFKLGKS